MASVAIAVPRVANPGPLGLAGFGLTTVVLSLINAGLLPHEAVTAVIPLAFAYGGVAQLIAGVLEFKTGNTFGMVAFTSFGLFWWWFALLQWTVGAGVMKAPAASGVAVTLLMWGALTFLLWIVTFRASKAVFGIFLLLWITFLLLGLGDFGHAPLTHAGGFVGLATGILAVLTAFAEVLNATAGRVVLGLGAPLIQD